MISFSGNLKPATPSPGSRAWNFDTCSGSPTPLCPPPPRRGGEGDVAFPLSVQGRHTGILISELDGWPASPRTHLSRHSLPDLRSLGEVGGEGGCYTRSVTAPSLGFVAKVNSWLFFVRLFHSLFQAGLSRRFH